METVRLAAPVGPTHACVGCGGLVPQGTGPTHPYMQASPGCWQIYGEVDARWPGRADRGPARWHSADAYAVQHPGGAKRHRRQRQSVAVHLIALRLLLEGGTPRSSCRPDGGTSQVVLRGLASADWPHLPPPRDLSAVTVADVHAASSAAQQDALATAWLESAWAAWEDHHSTVRTWVAILQEAPP